MALDCRFCGTYSSLFDGASPRIEIPETTKSFLANLVRNSVGPYLLGPVYYELTKTAYWASSKPGSRCTWAIQDVTWMTTLP
ncbi:hypothetical protein L484_007158 [Morus notabilis]|uniref:Uncharacterized protein n=1 Tax=Morus notabilis TaxID=981085 RepID=W9SNL2_9ROSA|nr:hypothetical protein L484_007158 [Morus notabilis]